MSNDFHPVKILKGYLEGDEASNEFAVLLKWNNIYYQKENKEVAIQKKVVRLGLIQWQMRLYKNFDELMQQANILLMLYRVIVPILLFFQNFLTLL